MTDSFMRDETFPEVKYVVAEGEANLIQVGGQTFFDMKDLESPVSINDFDAILEAGIKMGMAITKLRKEKR